MAPTTLAPRHLSDSDLLAEVARVAASERTATAALVALLAEMDVRKLHLAAGCSSLFTYCVEHLHLSEHAAYHRIQAARAVTAFPIIFDYLVSGALTLTAVKLLAPHLTDDNHRSLLDAARHRSSRHVESMVRALEPLPDVRSSVRKLSDAASPSHHDDALLHAPAGSRASGSAAGTGSPLRAAEATAREESRSEVGQSAPKATSGGDLRARHVEVRQTLGVDGPGRTLAAAARPAEIRVLSPERYSLRVTLSGHAHAKLRRAQRLMRHSVADGDPATIIDRALTLLVEQLERTKFAAKKQPQEKPLAQKAGEQRAAAVVSPKRLETRKSRGERRPAAAPVSSEGGDAGLVAPRTTSAGPPTEAPGERRSRHVPAAVKRDVWARDEGRCAFRGSGGRCRETGRLEFHHRLPVADGGASTTANVELRCAAHHRYESERWFGYGGVPPEEEGATRRATS